MLTFSPETIIYQHGIIADQLPLYLEKATNLVERWQGMDFSFFCYHKDKQAYFKQFFHDEGEYHLAALLSFDDLLPKSARQAFSLTTIEARKELRNLHHCKNLMMGDIKKGRNKDHNKKYIYKAIDNLIENNRYSRNHAFLWITKAHDISDQGFAKSDYKAFKLAKYFKDSQAKSDYPYISINSLRAEYQKYLKIK